MANTANYSWNIGFHGKNPWWDEWSALWTNVDTELYKRSKDLYMQEKIVYGSESSGGNLLLKSTSHATKGKIYLGDTYYFDEVNKKTYRLPSASQIMETIDFSPTESDSGKWNTVFSAGLNSEGGRYNQHFVIGYNVGSDGSSREKSSEPNLYMMFENNWKPGSNNELLEWHLDYNIDDVILGRPMAVLIDRVTGYIAHEYVCTTFSYRTPSNALPFLYLTSAYMRMRTADGEIPAFRSISEVNTAEWAFGNENSDIFNFYRIKYEHVSNGGMETGDPPTGWTAMGTPETFERSSVDKYSGTYSLHIVDSVGSGGGGLQVIPFVSGKTYTITFRYKIVSGTVRVATNDYLLNEVLSTTGSWLLYNKTNYTDAGAIQIRITNASGSDPAEFYIDDVSIVETDWTKLMSLDKLGNLDLVGSLKVDGTQVVGNRVIDARCDDAINSGDATTDGVIDALRDAMIAHGLIAAA